MQYTNDQEELLHPITTVLKAVDGAKKKMDAISEEIEGIEKASMHAHTHTHTIVYIYYTLACVQGFLPAELVGEACKGLHKRCVAASEQLMQNTESLDAIVCHYVYTQHLLYVCIVHDGFTVLFPAHTSS